VKILYSFNKRGAEADFWFREISSASSSRFTFIPFNHDPYLTTALYSRAQLLDNLYYDHNPGLIALYTRIEELIRSEQIDALVVDTCPPYHPDWLRSLPVFKALRIADGPLSSYDRDFAYIHAYDQILYHTPAYSKDLDLKEKLHYLGARKTAWWPLGLFDAAFDSTSSENQIFSSARDIDVIFIGALHLGKMPLIAKVKKAFGHRCKLYGLAGLKKNLYFNYKYGFPGWVSPIPQESYISLYRRAKIGFNIHNRGKYTLGGYRFFELPGNGVMQISDGSEYLDTFFKPYDEVVPYPDFDADTLIDLIKYYLDNPTERLRISRNGYRRVLKDYRISHLLNKLGSLLHQASL